tara:strand:+ start:1493 stop:1672 length:180 start_codon:yes stop_codon:yes gene_type:complete
MVWSRERHLVSNEKDLVGIKFSVLFSAATLSLMKPQNIFAKIIVKPSENTYYLIKALIL